MDNVLMFLGLMERAKAIAVGADSACGAAREGRARLLAYAADAADNTAAGLETARGEGRTPLVPLPYTKAELGKALGKGDCAAFAVTDTGMAKALCEKLGLNDPEMALDERLQRERRRKAKKKQAGEHALTGAAGRIAAKRSGRARTTDKRGK